MSKKLIIGGVLAGLIAIGSVSGGDEEPTSASDTSYAEEQTKEREASSEAPDASSDSPEAKPKPKPKPTKAAPAMSVAQENAMASAEDYLDYSSFSHKSLIEQLEFEGYSPADATFAVNHIKVDWNAQAAKSAKDYLDYSSFSRQGLIDQLTYEGFTPAQATYGVNQTGL